MAIDVPPPLRPLDPPTCFFMISIDGGSYIHHTITAVLSPLNPSEYVLLSGYLPVSRLQYLLTYTATIAVGAARPGDCSIWTW